MPSIAQPSGYNGAATPISKSRQSSLPMSRSHTASPARQQDRAVSAGTPKSSLSAFPRPPQTLALPKHLGTPLTSKKRTLRSTISIDEFPIPPTGAPKSPGDFSPSSSETTPLSSRQTSDSYAGRDSRTRADTASTRSSSSRPSVGGAAQRGRSSLGKATPMVEPKSLIASPGAHQVSSGTQVGSSENDEQGNVVISVRVRPEAGLPEEESVSTNDWYVDGQAQTITYQGREGGDYVYDNVFTNYDQNSRVYNSSAKRLVRRVMEGYHGTVFAYGMTGSGKTFSMQGTASSPGIIPLAITDIFSFIRETPQREFLLRVSYLEIYNEKIYDLLSSTPVKPGQKEEEIRLREDSRRGVYATPLKEEIVQSPTQLLRVIAKGDHRRRTSSTQYNVRSSRSHAVVQIVVESRERNSVPGSNKRSALLPGGVRISTLSLIDLAGSERAAETKERRTEGGHINKSLLTLGTVISKLSANKDNIDKDGKHIPYRDSKLTRLLQGALSGESLISILCTVQLGSNTIETLNTLKFAARARNNIVSHAKKAQEGYNANDPGSRALLEMYRSEILDLRKQLEAQKSESQKVRDEEEEKAKELEAETRHEEHMLEMQLMRTSLKERIDHLNKLILSSKSAGVNARKSGAYGPVKRLSDTSTRTSVYSRRGSRARQSSSSTISQLDRDTDYPHSRSSSVGADQADADEDDYSEDEPLEDQEKIDLREQITKLKAALTEKDEYISTLERLNRARAASASRSRTKDRSIGPATGLDRVLQEKEAEIAELKEKLEDKDRMVVALRNMAKRRELIDTTTQPPPQPVVSRSTSNPSFRQSVSRTISAEAAPPLPSGSISELLARRKASGLTNARIPIAPTLSAARSIATIASQAPSTPPTTNGFPLTPTRSSGPATPASLTSPSDHPITTKPAGSGSFFSTRRVSISSEDAHQPPQPPVQASTTPRPTTPTSASRAQSKSRSKSRRRSISSPGGMLPLTLAADYPSSPSDALRGANAKTPPPPPKSERRVSRQNVPGVAEFRSGHGSQGSADSGRATLDDDDQATRTVMGQNEHGRVQNGKMSLGLPVNVRTNGNGNGLGLVVGLDYTGRGRGENNGQRVFLENGERKNSLKAEFVGQNAF